MDTTHFRYNASAEFALDGWYDDPGHEVPLLPRTRLQPDTRHHVPVPPAPAVTHVRLSAYPDGGLSRLRLYGDVTAEGLDRLAQTWFGSNGS